MSNTASLENSKRLYGLSGWDDMPRKTSYDWHNMVNDEWELLEKTFFSSDAAKGRHLAEKLYPAYDAGYLLRKLPGTELYDATNCWQAENTSLQNWRTVQDTPEDALCLLAIKLFEEGVL